MKNFIQNGNVMEYNNSGSAISSGDPVVIGNRVGCAMVDIAATTGSGSVQMVGVFTFAKDGDEAFSQGDQLFFDSSDSTFTRTAAGNVWAGYAFESALEAATSCSVLLMPSPKQAAVVAHVAGDPLTVVPESFADEDAVEAYLNIVLPEIEARLDAQDVSLAAIIASLKASGQMANS